MSQFEEAVRYGGALNESDGEDAQRKAEERERKKAEVRKRLEEAGQKKQKKGFLTPERKKKLRKLLLIKAAEDLKRQQFEKEQERITILQQRTIPLPSVDDIEDHGKLEKIYSELFERLCTLEEEKYDINSVTVQMETTINQLNIEVNDLRGKFVKPSLKKVSKYDNKFKKMAEAKKSDETKHLRSQLKVVKKENVFAQLANTKKAEKPEWSKKKDEKKEEAAPEPVAEPVEEEVAEGTEEEEEEEEEEE